MIWGDPSPYEEKIQVDGRFEFGSKQFSHFASLNNIGLMIRSHEEVPLGYKSFFRNCLYTLFSTGGKENKHTYYNSVEPAFAVIKNDSYFFENSFIYQMIREKGTRFVNPLAKMLYTNEQIKKYQLNDEFLCSEEKWKHIKSLMADVLSGFA